MKIKKIIAGGLSILLAVGAISLAPGNGMVTYAATPPNIASQGAALYNANTGEFLYERWEQAVFPGINHKDYDNIACFGAGGS